MPIAEKGWELHIVRESIPTRDGRKRTIGSYQALHDGSPQQQLVGTAVETNGPGSNAVRGNGRRVEAGTDPLATQGGSHYVALGYHVGRDPDQTPRPAIELVETGK